MSLDGPPDSKGLPDHDALASTISDEIVQIHAHSYGSAGSASSFVLEDLVVSLIEIELLPSEEVVVEAGHPELVKSVRNGFEHAIEASFKAVVERATGRRVVRFMSETHVDPPFTVELFVLAQPRPETSNASLSSATSSTIGTS
jgi:uncharacterized protein YbcI